MNTEPLFKSTHSALVFAFNYAGQAAPPILYRLAVIQAAQHGKGLSGVDGAAQSGFIRHELKQCGRLEESIIIGRIAPSGFPCSCGRSCCSGNTKNMERADAVAVLADYLRSDALVGCVSDSILRKAYVDEYYGRSVQIGRELSPKTARSHKKLVRSTLSDIEKRAMEMIDARLREAGIVGDEN